jgi:hypothetical protein
MWFWYKKRKTPGITYGDCIRPVDAGSVPFLGSVPKPERIYREVTRKTAGAILLPVF